MGSKIWILILEVHSMKKEGHPPYQDVLFVDTATGTKFVCGSTLQPKETETYEGKDYPVYHVPISSASHPFFTGSQQLVDSEGRVDKFKKRYARKVAPVQEQPEKDKKAPPKKVAPKKVASKKVVRKKKETKE